MKFGLVVLGAHIGIHLKDEISKIKDSSILLVVFLIISTPLMIIRI